jgi:hypothetical protein
MKEIERNEKLKELATPEFLNTLTEVVKLFHSEIIDYIEVTRFVEDLHEWLNEYKPDLYPYMIDNEQD